MAEHGVLYVFCGFPELRLFHLLTGAIDNFGAGFFWSMP